MIRSYLAVVLRQFPPSQIVVSLKGADGIAVAEKKSKATGRTSLSIVNAAATTSLTYNYFRPLLI
jgi:hypothetical protein